MAKPAATPPTTGPIGAYRAEGGRFAAYDATGRTWPVTQDQAEAMGIREAKA